METKETLGMQVAVQQLLAETCQCNLLLRRQLRATRWLAGVLAALVLALGGCGLWAARAVNDTLGQMDFARLGAKIEQLDVEGLNRAVQSLEAQVKALDVQGINQALQEISGAAKGIEGTMQSFSQFTDTMNGMFGR